MTQDGVVKMVENAFVAQFLHDRIAPVPNCVEGLLPATDADQRNPCIFRVLRLPWRR